MPTRRRLLGRLGLATIASGALVVGTDALTSSEANRTSDVDVSGDADAFLQATIASPPLTVVPSDGSNDVRDLATVTNALPDTADVTFVDEDTSDNIVFDDGGNVSSPYTIADVATDSSVSIDVDVNGTSKDVFNFEIRGETANGTTVTLNEQYDIRGEEDLIAYYAFEGDTETTNVIDESGNGNDATISSLGSFTTYYDTGNVNGGNGLRVANDDYVSVPSLGGMFNDSFTVASWYKQSEYDQGRIPLIGVHTSDSAGEYFFLSVDNNNQVFNVDFGDADGTLASTVTLNLDTWYHYAVSYDSSADTTKIYVDGSEDVSGSQGPFTGSSPDIYLAARDSNFNLSNETYFDDTRFYDRALSQSKINDLYQLGG